MLIHAATDNDIHPPLFGAPQRTFGLMRGLAARHQVRVLCVVPNRSAAAREQTVAGVTLIRRRAWYTSVAWRLETAGLAPMFVVAGWHRAAGKRLAGALPGPAEVLLADLHLTGLFERTRAPLKVYTAHNVELDHFRMTRSRVLLPGLWAGRLARLEGRAVERADLTVVCCEEDAARMRALYGAEESALAVVPNGYDETAVRAPSPGERAAARAALGLGASDYAALFVGSDFPHNRDAASFLAERVMPALGGAGFRLLVAGGVARALAGRREPWLVVRPETPDLAPLLHAADCGLNPVTTGGGSNVKLPTCLAAGLAVITTPFGLRGYPALRPWVTLAGREETAEALRARPAGWLARGLELPAQVAEVAWGRLGQRLGERLEEKLRGGSDAVTGSRPGRGSS